MMLLGYALLTVLLLSAALVGVVRAVVPHLALHVAGIVLAVGAARQLKGKRFLV